MKTLTLIMEGMQWLGDWLFLRGVLSVLRPHVEHGLPRGYVRFVLHVVRSVLVVGGTTVLLMLAVGSLLMPSTCLLISGLSIHRLGLSRHQLELGRVLLSLLLLFLLLSLALVVKQTSIFLGRKCKPRPLPRVQRMTSDIEVTTGGPQFGNFPKVTRSGNVYDRDSLVSADPIFCENPSYVVARNTAGTKEKCPLRRVYMNVN